MNNKAQQMTLGTIIMIVLGIVVLICLIYGFSNRWKNTYCSVFEYEPTFSVIEEVCENYSSFLFEVEETTDGFNLTTFSKSAFTIKGDFDGIMHVDEKSQTLMFKFSDLVRVDCPFVTANRCYELPEEICKDVKVDYMIFNVTQTSPYYANLTINKSVDSLSINWIESFIGYGCKEINHNWTGQDMTKIAGYECFDNYMIEVIKS